MKIKNGTELGSTSARKAALQIADSGLQAIDTERVMRSLVKRTGDTILIRDIEVKRGDIDSLILVGIGKCSLEAVEVLETILGDAVTEGIVLDVSVQGRLTKIRAYEGSHPMPSEKNVHAAKEIVSLLEKATERDLVLFVISGGGSTLLCLPESEDCEEEIKVFKELFRGGATIQEINTIRKHLSLARGGYLAKHAYPARVISLILSDVPGDDLQFIASGPTVKDATTIKEAEEILAKYDVLKKCGIERCGLIETPKEDKYFERVSNILAVSNINALHAMAEKAKQLGYTPRICNSRLAGEARNVALQIIEELHGVSPKTVLLYGGETTVTVKGKGEGGRNLELAIAGLPHLNEGELLLTLASDGKDNGKYAGAICDIMTEARTRKLNLRPEEFLENNNEYPFFEAIGDFILTGDTGSNVSDLVVAVKS